MTAILWKDNKLLTDSSTFNGLEWVDIGNKVRLVRQMIFMQTDPSEPGDPILAITFTGAKAPVDALMHTLFLHSTELADKRRAGEPVETTAQFLLEIIGSVRRLALMNEWNNFTALLIGRDKNYTISIESGLTIHEKSEVITLGSAADHVQDVICKWPNGCSPIFALVNGMTKDTMSGGKIYQYETTPSKNGWCDFEMIQTGIYEEPRCLNLAMFSCSDSHYDPGPDLILNTSSDNAKLRRRSPDDNAVQWNGYVATFNQRKKPNRKGTRKS